MLLASPASTLAISWPSAESPAHTALQGLVGRLPSAAGATGPRGLEESLESSDAATLSPQAWCRRILNSLTQRKVEGREAGDLEMLLTFFIQLDPNAQSFTEMLAHYANDSRAEIAEAAGLLQRAWVRGRTGRAAPPMPPLAETLRTVGGLLDEALTRAAYVIASPDVIQIQMFGEPTQIVLGPQELHQEVAARAALRGQVSPSDPTSTDGYETRLRAVGTVLDEEPAQAFVLLVTRRSVVVEGAEHYYNVFTNEDLSVLLRTIVGRRPDASAESEC